MRIKNKHRLKQKECRNLLDKIHDQIDPNFNIEYEIIETGKIDKYNFIFLDGVPFFFEINNQLFYTLKGLLQFKPKNRYVVVDMGAVKFVTNGADVMAPGIVDADDQIIPDDMVWICDEIHMKPLAVGISVLSGEDLVNNTKGKAVILIHFIGDKIWKIISRANHFK